MACCVEKGVPKRCLPLCMIPEDIKVSAFFRRPHYCTKYEPVAASCELGPSKGIKGQFYYYSYNFLMQRLLFDLMWHFCLLSNTSDLEPHVGCTCIKSDNSSCHQTQARCGNWGGTEENWCYVADDEACPVKHYDNCGPDGHWSTRQRYSWCGEKGEGKCKLDLSILLIK